MALNLLDSSYYSAANPDLAAAGLITESQLQAHFQNFGLNEGRLFNPLIDLKFYQQANPDLAAAGLTTFWQLYDHLQAFGIKEGRRFSPIVDPDFYLGDNPDLVRVFGSDRVRAIEHLQNFGIDEGRRFSATFQSSSYRQNNSDLAALNFSNRQLLQHYALYGLDEGRSASEFFDNRFYRQINPDLVSAGLNLRQTVSHYVLWGRKEGRWLSDRFSNLAYLKANPDVKQVVEQGSLTSGFEHYFYWGAAERRPIRIIPNPDPYGVIGTIKGGGGVGYDFFGNSIATMGNNILVGAPGNDTGDYNFFNPINFFQDVGTVYLYNSTTGSLLQTFQSPSPKNDNRFGSYIAPVGNNVAIANKNYSDGIQSGVVYLFDSVTGNLQQTFNLPSSAVGGAFGAAMVAVDNNIIIGAPAAGLETTPGAVFSFDTITGNLLRRFENPTSAPSDRFGYSIATLGNNILIGAPGGDTTNNNGGVVYLFDRITGNLLRTFNNPSPNPGDFFGAAIATMGNNVLIGAPNDDTTGREAGIVYLFDAGTGNLLRTFNNPFAYNPSRTTSDGFGAKIVPIGNNILINAPYFGAYLGANNSVGVAYLFDANSGALLRAFDHPGLGNSTSGELMEIGAIGDRLLLGSVHTKVNGYNYAGAVYMY
jgi:FG-GAP repeat